MSGWKASGGRHREKGGQDHTEDEVFWHIATFGLYSILIGNLLLRREEAGLWPLVIYFVAMALHLVTNDFGLREDHKATYGRKGR